MAVLPTTNITTTLVANTLGVTTRNVGELCTSSKINMWSRRKPVRDSRNDVPEDEVGKGRNGDWGISVPSYDGTDTQVYTYLAPRGSSSEPYRLGDFRGYNHEAILPIQIIGAPSKVTETFNIGAFQANDEGQLTIQDIFGTQLYFAAEVFKNDFSVSYGWASGVNGVDIDLSSIVNLDKISVKFFLTDVEKDFDDPDVSHIRRPIPRKYIGENAFWYDVDVVSTGGDGGVDAEALILVSHLMDSNQVEIAIPWKGRSSWDGLSCRALFRDLNTNQILHTFSGWTYIYPGYQATEPFRVRMSNADAYLDYNTAYRVEIQRYVNGVWEGPDSNDVQESFVLISR